MDTAATAAVVAAMVVVVELCGGYEDFDVESSVTVSAEPGPLSATKSMSTRGGSNSLDRETKSLLMLGHLSPKPIQNPRHPRHLTLRGNGTVARDTPFRGRRNDGNSRAGTVGSAVGSV